MIVGVFATQEDIGAARDVVIQRNQQIFQIVESPLHVALMQLRKEAPHAGGDLQQQQMADSCIDYTHWQKDSTPLTDT